MLKMNSIFTRKSWLIRIIPFVLVLTAVLNIRPGPLDKFRKDKKRIRMKYEKQKKAILGRFGEFTSELKKARPGLDLSFPVDLSSHRRIGRIKLRDHNMLPGQRAMGRAFAFVVGRYALKSMPSENSKTPTTTVVKSGEKLEVLLMYRGALPDQKDKSFRWCFVQTGKNKQGYIPNTQLRNSPEEKPNKKFKKERKFVTVYSGLKMRDEPGLSGLKVGLIPYRAEVMVLKYSRKKEKIDGRFDYWAFVKYSEVKGWSFNAYLKPVAKKTKPKIVSDGKKFIMPFDIDRRRGRFVTSKFGRRVDPISGRAGRMHRGIDIAAPRWTPIRAAGSGRVYRSSYNRWYGNYHILNHGKGVYTYYCHQVKRRARRGARVRRGQVIGYVGRSGKATGHHLHFEVRIGGMRNKDARNPKKFLPF